MKENAGQGRAGEGREGREGKGRGGSLEDAKGQTGVYYMLLLISTLYLYLYLYLYTCKRVYIILYCQLLI